MGLAATKIDEQLRPTILVVEDDDTLREALCDTLELSDYQPLAANSAEQAMSLLARSTDIAMIVSDVNMGGISGHELLSLVRQQYPQIPMLLITAYASVNESVAAMRGGAVDYLVKPFESKLLIDAVDRHAGHRAVSNDEPVAIAPSSKRLLELAQRVATSESTVLIVGESGSGKEVLARYIHQRSPRADQAFVAINCAAIPENMLEAMLFGHEKGAYTGAHSSAPGKFEQANGGTLLLDEISEMDLNLQAKLLRVLQEREVERLGGRKTIKLDVRVIATSNRNLQQSVLNGTFREDLYYRLSVLPLQWAPLRERTEDILPLAKRLLEQHSKKQCRGQVSLSEDAIQTLLFHPWPGNVRELDNVMQRALIMQPGPQIQADDLGLIPSATQPLTAQLSDQLPGQSVQLPGQSQLPIQSGQQEAINQTSLSGSDQSETQPTSVQATGNPFGNLAADLGHDLKRKEFEIIVSAIRNAGGSRKLTAERLGISARTLRYKIARLKDEGLNVNLTVKNLT